MVKHTIIVSDKSRDNITVYTEEPAFVAVADRTDMNALKQLDEANRAGIYILMGENHRYVGQSATTIYSRLYLHNKDPKMDWWHKVIFFGREDGHLDKSQTDFLEGELIREFRQTGFTLTNATEGNSSWIDKTSKIHAKNVWAIVQGILADIANINLFDQPVREEVELTSDSLYIQLADGQQIFGKNPTQCYVNLFQHLLHDPKYRELVLEQVVAGQPSGRHFLGSEPNYSKNGQARSSKIDQLHLYTNLSTADKKRVLQRFADRIGLAIEVHWE